MFDDFILSLQCEEYYNEAEYEAIMEYEAEMEEN
jgi:hypothetical protein